MGAQTPVLIVGGSLNGLASALLLAHHGVRSTVVERHPGTSIQYKFAGISPRSMEIFRGLGIEAEIRARRTGDQQGGGVARGRNLSDPDLQWMRAAAWPDVAGLSPTDPATCDQHVLEPILRTHAERLGARTCFNTELTALEVYEDGIKGTVRNRASGAMETIDAAYLIAADGANGTLRERLGIGQEGPGVLQHWMNVIFETDLPATLQGKPLTSCFVTDLNGTITTRASGRWLLALPYRPERGEKPEDFDAAKCRELVAIGVGRPGVKADFVDARAWEVAARLAAQFRRGRAFLVGDAAHVMPPTGAFGGNTGIHDAHNLAWKLAAVLKGGADPALLDTYDVERRAVARHTLDQALARFRAWFKDPGVQLPPPVEMVDDYDVVFGQRYREGALISDDAGADGGAAARPFEKARELSARPGTRAPHLWIDRDDRATERVSTLDLFGRGFVVLSGVGGAGWCAAAERIGRVAGLPLACHLLSEWPAASGIGADGAVVVRPDGIVAWRSTSGASDPEQSLRSVFASLL